MSEETFTSAAFYRFLEEHKLMACRCRACGTLHLPPRPICTNCHGEEIEWIETSGQGTLRAFTTIHVAPTAMVEAGHGRDNPYCVGIVQLTEGPSISAQIVGVDATRPEDIVIGQPVQVVFIERGEGEEQHTYLAFRYGGASQAEG
jgi:uncharacterized OB-fold protein